MDPRDAYKSFECVECMQYQQTAPLTQLAQDLIQHLGQLDYEASVSSAQDELAEQQDQENEGAQLITGRGKGQVHSVPFVIVKIEEFIGTTIVTIDFFGKVTSRGATLSVVTLGASAVPGAIGVKHQKQAAKEHFVTLWQGLASKLGPGTLVASTINPDHSHNPVTFDTQNVDVSTDASIHDIEPFVYDPDQKTGAYNHVARAGQVASVGESAVKIGAKTGELALHAASGVTNFFPVIGVGFASAKLKLAKNKKQKNQAIGQLVGTLTLIPMAGFVGGQIGKVIGNKSDKKLTKFEVVENELLQKKKDALAQAGVHPQENDKPVEPEQEKHFYDRFNFFKRRHSRESVDEASAYRPEASSQSAEQAGSSARPSEGGYNPATTEAAQWPVISLQKDPVASPQENPGISLNKDPVISLRKSTDTLNQSGDHQTASSQ